MESNPDSAAPVTAPALSGDLFALLYDDLHRMARRERFRVGRPDTVQTTMVLHEAYVRLASRAEWRDRNHFMATASTAMRHVLVDAARARLTAKRGSGQKPAALDAVPETAGDSDDDRQLVKLGDALTALAAFDDGLTRLVDCRFFAGLTEMETAKVLGISDRTVRRRWLQARAWLHQEISLPY